MDNLTTLIQKAQDNHRRLRAQLAALNKTAKPKRKPTPEQRREILKSFGPEALAAIEGEALVYKELNMDDITTYQELERRAELARVNVEVLPGLLKLLGGDVQALMDILDEIISGGATMEGKSLKFDPAFGSLGVPLTPTQQAEAIVQKAFEAASDDDPFFGNLGVPKNRK